MKCGRSCMNYADRIRAILLDSNLLEEENERDLSTLRVDGIAHSFVFHKERLESHRFEIVSIAKELVPSIFWIDPDGSVDDGRGYTFLALPRTRRNPGELWGEQEDAENLLCLAIGIGLAGYTFHRALWKRLAGCVPYVFFDRKMVSILELCNPIYVG